MTAVHSCPTGTNTEQLKFKHIQTFQSTGLGHLGAWGMCKYAKEASSVIHTYHTSGADMPCTELPSESLQYRTELWVWWAAASCTHVSQTETVQQTHTPTHTFIQTDLSSLSHPLPSCRKFLMILIISVHAVSTAKSKHVHAHTQQTGTQSI